MNSDLFSNQPAPVDHRCLACGIVHAGAHEIRLADGTLASTYSEAWRLECEARTILEIPGLHARQNTLAIIERKRGKPAADRLRAAMMTLWQLAQPAA